MAGLDEVDEHPGWLELFALEPVVKDAHHVQAHVQADEVGQLERPHRVVQPDPGSDIDVVGGPESVGGGAHRLGQEWHQDAIDDEPGPVGGHDDLLAKPGGQLPDRGLGRVRRVRAAN